MDHLRTRKAIGFPLFIVMGFLLSVGPSNSGGRPPEEIALHEAEILIYMLPDSIKIRSEGMEIGWEIHDAEEFNQKDFYVFWVYNAKRRDAGSVTVGHFAVNKHTADVWEFGSDTLVKARELDAIQKILRKGHNIDQQTIEKYRHRSPNLVP